MAENNVAQSIEELGVRIGIIAKSLEEWENLDGFIPRLGEKVYITDLFLEEENQMGYIIGNGENELFSSNGELKSSFTKHHLIEDRLATLEKDSADDFLESVEYDSENKILRFTWSNTGNTTNNKTIEISVDDFAKIYSGGNLISIDENDNTINHKVPASFTIHNEEALTYSKDNFGHIKQIKFNFNALSNISIDGGDLDNE